jgi:hypothetical protein
MPGYLSNRVISLLPATESELAAAEANISSLDVRLTTAEGDIEDLQLNVGV